jgi:hypothetical protein
LFAFNSDYPFHYWKQSHLKWAALRWCALEFGVTWDDGGSTPMTTVQIKRNHLKLFYHHLLHCGGGNALRQDICGRLFMIAKPKKAKNWMPKDKRFNHIVPLDSILNGVFPMDTNSTRARRK